MPLVLAGTATIRALTSASLKASTLPISGLRVPERTATPRAARARSTSLPARIRPAAGSAVAGTRILAGALQASRGARVAARAAIDEMNVQAVRRRHHEAGHERRLRHVRPVADPACRRRVLEVALDRLDGVGRAVHDEA